MRLNTPEWLTVEKRYLSLADAEEAWPGCSVMWDRDCPEVIMTDNYLILVHDTRMTQKNRYGHDGVERATLTVWPDMSLVTFWEWLEDEGRWVQHVR